MSPRERRIAEEVLLDFLIEHGPNDAGCTNKDSEANRRAGGHQQPVSTRRLRLRASRRISAFGLT